MPHRHSASLVRPFNAALIDDAPMSATRLQDGTKACISSRWKLVSVRRKLAHRQLSGNDKSVGTQIGLKVVEAGSSLRQLAGPAFSSVRDEG